jgi:hypothetical protein
MRYAGRQLRLADTTRTGQDVASAPLPASQRGGEGSVQEAILAAVRERGQHADEVWPDDRGSSVDRDRSQESARGTVVGAELA